VSYFKLIVLIPPAPPKLGINAISVNAPVSYTSHMHGIEVDLSQTSETNKMNDSTALRFSKSTQARKQSECAIFKAADPLFELLT